MRKSFVVILAFITVGINLVTAQSSSEPKLPRERLNYFAGTWNIEIHMKTGALNSRTYFTMERNEWVPDHSLLLSRPEGEEAVSAGGLAVMGYNVAKNMYWYHIVKTSGNAEELQGTVDGRTWTWTTEGVRAGEQSPRTRITMKEISSSLYTLRVETALENGGWSPVMEGNAKKILPHSHQDVAFLR
jgi:hypothetical protein